MGKIAVRNALLAELFSEQLFYSVKQ